MNKGDAFIEPKLVRLVEVGPRDGLQNIGFQYGLARDEGIIPAADKIAFIDALSKTGLSDIEIASFVSPKAVPQMADGLDVANGIARQQGVMYWALVPNIKGLESAIEARLTHIAVFTAASEQFNQANINKSIDESLEAFRPVIERAKPEGMRVRGYVSTAVYCPYEGKIAPEKVLDVCEKLFAMGVDEVSIGDTIGTAKPEDVTALLDVLTAKLPVEKMAMHFHDTHGNALDNIRVSLKYGITTFDSSVGGFGGCPYAPGASGNVSTESVVRLMQELGIETGVNLEMLEAASQLLGEILTRTQVHANV